MPRRQPILWLLAATLSSPSLLAQTEAAVNPPNKAAAYYHAAMGHLYAELSGQYGGRGEFLQKAIDNYKQAMQADPDASILAQELAELYLQSGMLRSAINEFEEVIRRSPGDVNARRILGRFYTARIREGQQGRVNEEMLKKAIEQYLAVSQIAPQDSENWVLLGRLHKLGQDSVAAEKAYLKAIEIEPNNEDALTGLAMVYSDLGDHTRSGEMLKRVTDRNPSARTLTALAATYEQMKEFKLAAGAYKQALAMNKENTDLKRAYAQALYAAEENDEALAVFEELIAEEPNDLLAALRLSQIYREKRDFQKAKEYSSKAKQLDPNNLEIRFNEVNLLEAEGKTQESITVLKEMLATMPLRPDSVAERNNKIFLLERLGMLYRSVEQTEPAVAVFREIMDLDASTGVRASAQIVDTYRAGKDFAAAEREAVATLKKYPNERLAKLVMANVLTDLGKYKDADTLLRTLLDGKNDRDTYISLAQVYEKSKNFAEMSNVLDMAEKLSESEEEKSGVWFMRGAMLERQKKYDAAEAEFRKVLKLNPKSAAALNYLGYMLADRNLRLVEAQEMIQKAVDMEPHNAAYLDSLGWVYYRLNRLDEAADALRRSLERGSRDPTVHDHLGDVLVGQGKLKEAMSQWERAIREWKSNAPSDNDPAEIAKLQEKLEGARVRLAKEASVQIKQP